MERAERARPAEPAEPARGARTTAPVAATVGFLACGEKTRLRMHTGRVLIVEDLAAGREILARELVDAGLAPTFASNPREAIESFQEHRLELVVADHRRPGFDAIDLVRRLRLMSAVPIVVMTSSGSIADCEAAMRVGANRFLQFRADVERLGKVARDLISIESRKAVLAVPLSTEEARALGRHEFRGLLQRLVVECRGNIAEIARRLDRDRSTIRYHLRRMGMLD